MTVSATSHVQVQSLTATPDGSLANLSAVAPQPSRFEAEAWVLNPASNAAQAGVLRVNSRKDRAGTALIAGFDDAGNPEPGGGALLILPALAAVDLGAVDLEQGAPPGACLAHWATAPASGG